MLVFTDSRNWGAQGTVYCYYWTDAEGEAAAWPGKPMELLGKNEYNETQYALEIPIGANFIITNQYVQTVDLVFNGENGFYPQTANDEGKFTCGSW